MKKIKGKYTSANVYASMLDENAKSQIEKICDQRWLEGCHVAIMPDAHMGKDATVGTTIKIDTRVAPTLVGSDIGCGMLVMELGKMTDGLDMEKFHSHVSRSIPTGFQLNRDQYEGDNFLVSLKCYDKLSKVEERILRSIGTLGGGNHFIEMNEDSDGNRYVVIHSGSRNLGKQVADIYGDLAKKEQMTIQDQDKERDILIKHHHLTDQQMKIPQALKELTERHNAEIKERMKYIPYLVRKDFDDYIHDINIVQKFASLNRNVMMDRIEQGIRHIMNIDKSVEFNRYETIHNYIDVDEMIVRKGAISAQKGEKVIIPINMAEGSIIAYGKGNKEANYSGPHGAGRIMSRKEARENITLEEFKDSMEGVYSQTVVQTTIDEAPKAYKPLDVIIDDIKDLVEVDKIIKPIYNFKAK